MIRFTLVFTLALFAALSIADDAPPEPKLPAGYTLQYAQDFADEASLGDFAFASGDDFRRVQVGDRWAMEYGNESRKSKYSPPHRSPLYIGLIDGKRFGSFVLEYDVQQRSKTGAHRDHCVFFGFVDPANFYYTHIAQASDPNAHQVMLVDDAPRRPITAKGTKGYDWGELDKWHHVRVDRDVEAGTIAVYVNDMAEPIMTATDKTHGAGFIGFGSFDDLGRVTNIKVWAKDAEKAECGFFKRLAAGR